MTETSASRETNSSWVSRARRVFTPNYAPAEVVFERGEGVYLFDVEGRRYLDMTAGIAVSALGHNHPRLVEAIAEQARKVLHLSNLYYNRPSIELAERLVEHSFGERVFFCNSGTEANEAAIKLARRYHFDRGDHERIEIVSFERSFHGRTYGSLAATAQKKYQEGFGPMPSGFSWLPMGDLFALDARVTDKTAAILVEPVQGEGGVNVPPPGFLAECRRIATGRGALLIMDEIQTGIGRTGRLFAHQHEGVEPDIMSLAKGLGGGLPIGAVIARAEVGDVLSVGRHGTTFGGNPVACAAGCAVLDVVTAPGFLEHVAATGAHLFAGLEAIRRDLGLLAAVRGRGLIVGGELHEARGPGAAEVVKAARSRGVLIHVAGPRVLRLVPPLVIDSSHVDMALSAIEASLRELAS